MGVNVTTHSKIFIYQLALNCWLRVVLGEDKFPGISDPILIGRAALRGFGGRYSGKNSWKLAGAPHGSLDITETKITTQMLNGKTKACQEHNDKDVVGSSMYQQCGMASNLQRDHRLILWRMAWKWREVKLPFSLSWDDHSWVTSCGIP